MLDKLISGALQGLGGGSASNEPLMQIIGGLLSGSGGLAGLVQQLQQAGLGAQAQSWVGTGQNLPISVDELIQVFGGSGMQQMAATAGMDQRQLGGQLAELLPQVVDRLTPEGRLPGGGVEDALGALSKLMPR